MGHAGRTSSLSLPTSHSPFFGTLFGHRRRVKYEKATLIKMNSAPCNDNGTWAFTSDDVRGQEFDAGNNFGQAGGFQEAYIAMYPNRAIPSSTCEFCVKKRGLKKDKFL